jgi:hypothetical protein
MRLSAEEKGTKVFDELTASDRLDIHQLVKRTAMNRAAVYHGIRWLRDTLGDEALICNADETYELAMTNDSVRGYRQRRQQFFANSLRRLQRIIEASEVKFGADSDTAIAIEMIRTAARMLDRGIGGSAPSAPERVH